jgi:hypothetical protein
MAYFPIRQEPYHAPSLNLSGPNTAAAAAVSAVAAAPAREIDLQAGSDIESPPVRPVWSGVTGTLASRVHGTWGLAEASQQPRAITKQRAAARGHRWRCWVRIDAGRLTRTLLASASTGDGNPQGHLWGDDAGVKGGDDGAVALSSAAQGDPYHL